MGTHWIPTRYHGGKNDMIFQNIMPTDSGNYVFENPAGVLCSIRLLATNTKKNRTVFYCKIKFKEASVF